MHSYCKGIGTVPLKAWLSSDPRAMGVCKVCGREIELSGGRTRSHKPPNKWRPKAATHRTAPEQPAAHAAQAGPDGSEQRSAPHAHVPHTGSAQT